MNTKAFYDPRTSTLTYVVWDAQTKDAVLIDPVLDYDAFAIRVYRDSADAVATFIDGEELSLRMVLETHPHADHLSAAQYFKARYDAPVAIGHGVQAVQNVFKGVFNLDDSFDTDGSQFDRLLSHGETVRAGSLNIEVIGTPGHTPACVSFKIEDAVYAGDAIFMPDFGTGRCDFPAGSAEVLYDSVVNHLYTLPDSTRVFVGHDYQPGGRALAYETTVGACKADNIQLPAGRSKSEFVKFRRDRDKVLNPPALLFPSIQVNIAAGALPEPADNGRSYLKLPVGLFDEA